MIEEDSVRLGEGHRGDRSLPGLRILPRLPTGTEEQLLNRYAPRDNSFLLSRTIAHTPIFGSWY